MRIGYLIPEFPSQTHVFFWREIDQLERLGAEVDVVSTRRPVTPAPHRWVQEAIARTTYLHPMRLSDAPAALWRGASAGPAAWGRSAAVVAASFRESATRPLRMSALAAMGARVASLGRQRRWDHLHVHSCADAANVALFAHLLSRLPYSLTLHGDLGGYGGNQARKWRHASFAIVICRALIEQVRAALGDNVPARVYEAPMGVDLQAFTRRAPYAPFTGGGAFRVLCCGRLHPGKGHEDLIEATRLVRQADVDMHLTIAGDEGECTGYRARLESLIAEKGLVGAVRLAGALSEQAVRDHLESSHAFALASHIEGLGVATMEAMAMQLPVVVTRSGGVAELVEDGRSGLLVEPRQPRQMADALAKLAALPRSCVEMGEAGRRRVERSYHSGLSARAIVNGVQESQARGESVRRQPSMQPVIR